MQDNLEHLRISAHKIQHIGTGPRYWARCSCDLWCWLGTYAPSKGRRALAKAEFDRHLVYVKKLQDQHEAEVA